MKTAFVLSGGGAKGSFQVGALKYLCKEKGIVPDVVIGISTGSLQGLAVAQQDLDALEQVWLNIKKDSDIYTKSVLNYGKCLLGIRNGVYEFDGLRKILSRFFNKDKLMQSPIDFYVGKVSLQKTDIVYVNKKDMVMEDVLSSCTIPVFFSTVDRSGLQWVDGGVRDIVPLKKAIDLNVDVIYVFLCSPKRANVVCKKYKNVVEVLERVLDILLNEIYVNDIDTATKINEMIDRFGSFNNYKKIDIKVIEPDFDITDSLDFDPSNIRRGIQHGYRKAEEIVK